MDTYIGEKSREVRDTSLRVPHGEAGTIVDIKIFTILVNLIILFKDFILFQNSI